MGRLKLWLKNHWIPAVCFVGALISLSVVLSIKGDDRSSLFVRKHVGDETPWDGVVDGKRVSWAGVVKAHGRWFDAVSVGLRFATYHQSIGIHSGTLTIGACRYITQNDEISDNALLFFEAEPSCRLEEAYPKAASLEEVPFTVVFEVDESRATFPPRIAAWAHGGWNGVGFLLGQGANRKPLFDELVHRYAQPMSRFELLAETWGLSKTVLTSVLIIAFLIFGIGLICWQLDRRNLGAAILFTSMSLIVCVLVPPFQAPDEPDHFLSYARITGQNNLIKEALHLANRGHFPIVRHNPQGSFDQYEVGFPSSAPWQMRWQGAVYDSKMELRAPLVAALWAYASKPMLGFDVSAQLLGLRIASAVFIGIIVFFVGWLLSGSMKGDGLAWVFLLAPALPFFAMHVSNYSFLWAFSIFAVAASVAAGRGGVLWLMSSLLLVGIAITACLLTSRNGVLVIPLVACVLLMQFGLRIWKDGTTLPKILFIGFIFGVLFQASLIPFTLGTQISQIAVVTKKLGAMFGWGIDVKSLSWMLPVLIGVMWCATLSVLAFVLLFARRRERLVSGFRKVLPASVYLIILALIVLSFKGHYRLPAIEGVTDVNLQQYLASAVKTFARDLTIFGNDFLISASFWTGFGWLDATFPEWFGRMVKFVPVALVLVALWKGRSRLQTWWVFGWFGLSLLLALCLSAAAAFSIKYNLHGRYLLSFYGCGLIFAAVMFRLVYDKHLEWRRLITSTVLVYICSIHAYTWGWVLNRYF